MDRCYKNDFYRCYIHIDCDRKEVTEIKITDNLTKKEIAIIDLVPKIWIKNYGFDNSDALYIFMSIMKTKELSFDKFNEMLEMLKPSAIENNIAILEHFYDICSGGISEDKRQAIFETAKDLSRCSNKKEIKEKANTLYEYIKHIKTGEEILKKFNEKTSLKI